MYGKGFQLLRILTGDDRLHSVNNSPATRVRQTQSIFIRVRKKSVQIGKFVFAFNLVLAQQHGREMKARFVLVLKLRQFEYRWQLRYFSLPNAFPLCKYVSLSGIKAEKNYFKYPP